MDLREVRGNGSVEVLGGEVRPDDDNEESRTGVSTSGGVDFFRRVSKKVLRGDCHPQLLLSMPGTVSPGHPGTTSGSVTGMWGWCGSVFVKGFSRCVKYGGRTKKVDEPYRKGGRSIDLRWTGSFPFQSLRRTE